MTPSKRRQSGLKLGLLSLGVVMLGFLGVFLFGPAPSQPVAQRDDQAASLRLLDVLGDAPTRQAVEALRAVAPATYAELDAAALFALNDGADSQDLAYLTLQALFAELRNQALAMRSAQSADYQAIMAGLAEGLRELKTHQSDWCNGETIGAYLAQNDSDLVPTLLAEFPYQSPQYNWAMAWMRTILATAKRAQDQPQRYSRPGFRDEATLQETGLALGSEQWSLGLQIFTFANSEGTSYANMQDAVSSMDVCDLGLAVETVSERLPPDVRARIWADLMPEIMIGNTPYVLWRVNDYFFIG